MNPIEQDANFKSKTCNSNVKLTRPFLPQKVFTYTDEEIRRECENMQKLRELRQKYLPTTIKMTGTIPKFIQSQNLEKPKNLNIEEEKPEILLLKSKNNNSDTKNNAMSEEYEKLKNDYDKLRSKYEDLKSEKDNDKFNDKKIFNNYENIIKILVNHINETNNNTNLLNYEQIINSVKDNDNANNLISELEKKLNNKGNINNNLKNDNNKSTNVKNEIKNGKGGYYDSLVKKLAKNDDIIEITNDVAKASYWSGNKYITEN